MYNKGNRIFVHYPYEYSTEDPMGTLNWRSTQVANLLDTKRGNCFALASLFKILSDRLGSDANLCTVPGHIYIAHENEQGTRFNVELTSGSFPGTGTLMTLSYTTKEAIQHNISLRDLNLKQSVALCLVYLGKGYEARFSVKGDDFSLQCAGLALRYDSLNLNAMLQKAAVIEERLVRQGLSMAELREQKEFKTYEALIAKLYRLGYREMPLEMKNIILAGYKRDTLPYITRNHTPKTFSQNGIQGTRYASLSWGLFDEMHETKSVERYGNTLFDVKTERIKGFAEGELLYNQYNFDPVAFAWNVDPLAHKFPWQSPYAGMDNSPIWKNDPTGESGEVVIDKQTRTATVFMNINLYGSKASTELATATARDVQNLYNKGNGTVKIGGVDYKVQFQVTGNYLASDGPAGEVAVAGTIASNTSARNNYFRVEESTPTGASFARILGNSGMFVHSEIGHDGSTTEGHELGHGLGLRHNYEGSWQTTIKGEPDLMDVRSDKVEANFTDKYALPDGTLNINKREVSKRNFSNIFTPGVINSLEKSGKATIGSPTNTYYTPGGTEVKTKSP